MFNTFVFVVLLVAFIPSQAHAYIEPGSGSAIISAIIGLIAAVALGLKTYAYKIKSLFGLGGPGETGKPDGSADK